MSKKESSFAAAQRVIAKSLNSLYIMSNAIQRSRLFKKLTKTFHKAGFTIASLIIALLAYLYPRPISQPEDAFTSSVSIRLYSSPNIAKDSREGCEVEKGARLRFMGKKLEEAYKWTEMFLFEVLSGVCRNA